MFVQLNVFSFSIFIYWTADIAYGSAVRMDMVCC